MFIVLFLAGYCLYWTDEVLQENHYYPFGMNTEGDWLTPGYPLTTNKYQYNGKELNEDFNLNWNDYGARWYDGAVGRFLGVDPLAENHYGVTPFNYVLNNPVLFIDPFGLDTAFTSKEAHDLFDKAYQKIQDKIDAIDKNTKWSSRKKTRKKRKYLADKKVFDDVIGAKETFTFSIGKNKGIGSFFSDGKNMYIELNANDESNVFHECIHIGQYMNGEIDFDNKGKPLYYDYSDEYEAYRGQFTYSSRYLGIDLYRKALEGHAHSPGTVSVSDVIKIIIKVKYGGKSYIINSYTPVNKP